MTPPIHRRRSRLLRWFFCLGFVLSCALPLIVLACGGWSDQPSEGHLEHVWGEQGVRLGQLYKPRALAIDDEDRLYVVDKTARIQVFDRDGKFLHGWRTPAWQNGKPTGLSFDLDGNLMVADTHYFRILFYRPDGTLLEDRTIGGEFGQGPGQFHFVTDAVMDSKGCVYVAEYGDFDRIQKFSPEGEFMFQWGGHGSEPGQFSRPQNLALDEQDRLWVCDACNHRIQVFDANGSEAKLINLFGELGSEPGQLRYPYDLILVDEYIYICEFGNHRVQAMTREGESLATWGTQGRAEGELFNPWALVRDQRGRVHILDTYNHRIQRVQM